jgi:hypothetical protein
MPLLAANTCGSKQSEILYQAFVGIIGRLQQAVRSSERLIKAQSMFAKSLSFWLTYPSQRRIYDQL